MSCFVTVRKQSRTAAIDSYSIFNFLLLDTILVCCGSASMCASVCLSQAGIVPKWQKNMIMQTMPQYNGGTLSCLTRKILL